MKRLILTYFTMLLLAGFVYGATVDMLIPNGGEQWKLGTTKVIKWKSKNFTGNVMLILLKNMQKVGTIAQNIGPNTTTYSWKVGDYQGGTAAAGPGYRIRVKEEGGAGIMDASDADFTITTGFVGTITRKPGVIQLVKISVTKPNNKSNWETGKTYQITWTGAPSGSMKVQLYNYNGKKFLRDIGQSSTGSISWTIPKDVYKWPGNYKIRVATTNNITEGFSDMFHIGTQAATTSYTFNGTTDNKYKYRRKAKKSFTMECPIDEDPGPGKMRVGYHNYASDHTDCATIYRSFVSFNVDSLKGKGMVLKASMTYNAFMGDNCNTRVYMLEQKWNGAAESLFTVSVTQVEPGNMTSTVQKWLAYPNANYGLVVVGPNESMQYNNSKCVSYCDAVKLHVDMLGQAQ